MAKNKFFVNGDEYQEIDRKMLEIKRQLLQKSGCPLDPQKVKIALQDIVEGQFRDVKYQIADYNDLESEINWMMNGNCFLPRDWQNYYNIELKDIVELPVSIEKLREILESQCPFVEGRQVKDTHYLMYLPKEFNGEPLTVMKWKQIHPPGEKQPCFYEQDWYQEYDWAKKAVAEKGWYLAFIGLLPKLFCKSWSEQLALLPENYYVPKIIEALSLHFLAFRKNAIRINENAWGRTADLDSDGGRVVLGDLEANSLVLYDHLSHSFVGLFAFRKLDFES